MRTGKDGLLLTTETMIGLKTSSNVFFPHDQQQICFSVLDGTDRIPFMERKMFKIAGIPIGFHNVCN